MYRFYATADHYESGIKEAINLVTFQLSSVNSYFIFIKVYQDQDVRL